MKEYTAFLFFTLLAIVCKQYSENIKYGLANKIFAGILFIFAGVSLAVPIWGSFLEAVIITIMIGFITTGWKYFLSGIDEYRSKKIPTDK